MCSSAADPCADAGWRTLHASGPEEVAHGVHRIPLPLPQDGLRAVNVYPVESDRGAVHREEPDGAVHFTI